MRQTQLQKDMNAVFERLMADPFTGTTQQLADELDITFDRVRDVLNHVRNPEFVEENGWTIPYVKRGAIRSHYFIFDTKDKNEAAKASQRLRAGEMHRTTRRNLGQARLARSMCDGRSTEAKHWGRVITMYEAAAVHLEALLDSD